MALKDLPVDYQPRKGDLRSQATETGVFNLSIYTGEAWAALHGVIGANLAVITNGLTNQGRSQGEGSPAYTWRDESQEWPAPPSAPWWAVRSTPGNTRWKSPAYGLGEMVWRRFDPTGQAFIVEGVKLVEGWFDDEDERYSQEQTWEYHLSGRGGNDEEGHLIRRVELATVVVAETARRAQESEFDPFLDGNELLEGRKIEDKRREEPEN